MRRFKYVGDQPVDVDSLGALGVDPGEVVEVEDPAISDAMDDSPLWEHIPDPKRSRAAKKAAQTRADNDETPEG